MAGSDATFRFKALGELSLRIEELLYPMLESSGRPGHEEVEVIDGLLRDMQEAVPAADKLL